MIEYKACGTSDLATFTELISNIKSRHGHDITPTVTKHFIANYADAWLPACDMLAANIDIYKKKTAMPRTGYVDALALEYDMPKGQTKAFDDLLLAMVKAHTVRREEAESRVPLNVAVELQAAQPLIDAAFHAAYESALRMLDQSHHEWYYYQNTSTPIPRQAAATVADIHYALAHAKLLKEVCNRFPRFDCWRQELLALCQEHDMDLPLPRVFANQWDDLVNDHIDAMRDDRERMEDGVGEASELNKIELRDFGLFDKKMQGVLKSKGVSMFPAGHGEEARYDEGVVTAWKTFRLVRCNITSRSLSLSDFFLKERVLLARQEARNLTQPFCMPHRPNARVGG